MTLVEQLFLFYKFNDTNIKLFIVLHLISLKDTFLA